MRTLVTIPLPSGYASAWLDEGTRTILELLPQVLFVPNRMSSWRQLALLRFPGSYRLLHLMRTVCLATRRSRRTLQGPAAHSLSFLLRWAPSPSLSFPRGEGPLRSLEALSPRRPACINAGYRARCAHLRKPPLPQGGPRGESTLGRKLHLSFNRVPPGARLIRAPFRPNSCQLLTTRPHMKSTDGSRPN